MGEGHKMKTKIDKLEAYRVTTGFFASSPDDGLNGIFIIPSKPPVSPECCNLVCIASNGMGWEHVSVEVKFHPSRKRLPSWNEMSHIKDMFWESDETVLEFHPKKSDYVNVHPWVLHLWKKVGVEHELPPVELV
jgi:hypothetical protein